MNNFMPTNSISHLNKSVSIKGIDSTIKNLPKQKASGPDNSTKHLNKIVYQFSNLFQKVEAEGNTSYSFYKTGITLIPKPD